MFEHLESRVCLSAALNTNLIVNPGAELGPASHDGSKVASIPGWKTIDGNPTVVRYGSAPQFDADPTVRPTHHGHNFFAGGPVDANGNPQEADLYQVIDVSNLAPLIDAGRVVCELSGSFGGYANEFDNAILQVRFEAGAPTALTTGGAYVTDDVFRRVGTTELKQSDGGGFVAQGTRTILVDLGFGHGDNDTDYNNGYADNLNLTLISRLSGNALVSGSVYNDVNGNGTNDSNEIRIPGITVFNDSNDNGVLDAGEANTLTKHQGNYSLVIPSGKQMLRAILPSGYRATSSDPRITSGGPDSVSKINFMISQTPNISGRAFVDHNGNGLFDSGDTPLANTRVYLDLNDNSRFDLLDLSVLTGNDGTYEFNVPDGSYAVRELPPAGFRQTGPSGSLVWTLKLGLTTLSTADNFANIST